MRRVEENIRRALVFSNGEVTTFVTHPMSATLLALTLLLPLLGGKLVLPERRHRVEP